MPDSFIPLAIPELDEEDARSVYECVKSTFVSSVGPLVGKFEEHIARFTGAPHAVAASSGTTAMTLALRALGVGAGDVVIAPDFTFVATVNPAVNLGAEVVLVDPEPETMNPDPDRVLEAVDMLRKEGRRPKAVVFVHLYGVPGKLGSLVGPLGDMEVPLVEDAAESLGASWTSGPLAGRHTGTAGICGILSFNGNKIITCGGGGMVLTSSEALAGRMKHLSTQARRPGIEYDHDDVGYNFRLTNLQASLGLSQLSKLGRYLERKHEIRRRYDRAFGSLAGVLLHPSPQDSAGSDWLYTVRLDSGISARVVIDELRTRGIEARPVWTPVHMQKPYIKMRYVGNGVSEKLHASGISLPSSVGMTEAQQDRVIEEFISIVESYSG